MRFIDLNDGHIYTLCDLKNEWKIFQAEEPQNHAARFQIEMLEILMATINGRNDLRIIGMTPSETNRMILRLRAQL